MPAPPSRRALPPVLLADATWYGTLAAARDLGSRGVPVTLASDVLLAPARASRFVTRSERCPPTRATYRFLEWLVSFGRRNPGHVLYPTSDDVAWLAAAHRDELAPLFHLYSAPLASYARLLDKSSLVDAAREAGLDAPDTRSPATEVEVEAAAAELGYPLFIKARTQVMLADWTDRRKGCRVSRPEELLPQWRALRTGLVYGPEVIGRMASLEVPILQASYPASERILTVDGFVGEEGGPYAAIACEKVLQLPRRTGPGVCFEEVPLDPNIAGGLRRLFRAVGFHGVFDAEFLIHGDRRLLIDVNPRFYNHMAYEVDRGVPLPWMAYLAACGDRAALAREVEAASAVPLTGRAYIHHLPTSLMLRLQGLTAAMDRGELARMRAWLDAHEHLVTDPVVDPGDPRPGLMDYLTHAAAFLRHPRSFLRHFNSRGQAPATAPRRDTIEGRRPGPARHSPAEPSR